MYLYWSIERRFWLKEIKAVSVCQYRPTTSSASWGSRTWEKIMMRSAPLALDASPSLIILAQGAMLSFSVSFMNFGSHIIAVSCMKSSKRESLVTKTSLM